MNVIHTTTYPIHPRKRFILYFAVALLDVVLLEYRLMFSGFQLLIVFAVGANRY